MPKIWMQNTRIDNFEEEVNSFVHLLQKKGVKKNKVIGIKSLTNEFFIKTYHACSLLKVVIVILAPNQNLSVDNILNYLDYLVIQVTPSLYEFFTFERKEHLPVGVAVVSRSSGTSGDSKYICWHHPGIEHQCQATMKRMTYSRTDCFFVTMPLWSSYGLSMVHILQRLKNNMVFLKQLQKPSVLNNDLIMTGATTFHGTPQIYLMLFDWLSKNQTAVSKLKTIRIWDCGGDKLSIQLSRAWLKLFGKPILDGYGLSEAGPNVSLNSIKDYKIGTVGKPIEGVTLYLNTDHELKIKSPSLLLGMLNPVKKLFIPHKASSWLSTNDYAKIDPDGYLSILGRKNNVLIINGFNVNPEAVEEVIQSFPGVQSVGVTAIPSKCRLKLIALIVMPNELFLSKKIRQYCSKQIFAPQSIPHKFYNVSALPLNSNGKIDRIALKSNAIKIAMKESCHNYLPDVSNNEL